ncbi:MAG TPA: metallophosphoesterase family protein [Candidatus Eisenbacteria bacterium]
MRWALFSDIHGNLEALEVVLDSIRKARVDRMVCLGDIVGYGASPNECVGLVKGSGATTIAGNHDHAALGLLDIGEFNDHARAAILWTQEAITPETAAWLREREMVVAEEGIRIVHASPGHPAEWNYILTPMDAAAEFRTFEEPVCFVGHSHVPGLFLGPSAEDAIFAYVQESMFPANEPITLPVGRRAILNVGSVGQPRDRDPRAAWLLYDDETGTVILNRLMYDLEAAQHRILEAGLPPFLAYRLGMGS